MFPVRFFCNSMFAPRFFPKVGSGSGPTPSYPGESTLVGTGVEQSTFASLGVQKSTLGQTGVTQSTFTKRTS